MKEIVINNTIIYRVDVGNKHAQMALSFKTLKELQAVFGENFEAYVEKRLIQEIWNLTLEDYEQPDN